MLGPSDLGLGDDLAIQNGIDFEADPLSLQMILENRSLSPSVLQFRSSLTPAVTLHKSLQKKKNVEYFQGKDGAIFYRPKIPNPPPSSNEKFNQRKFGRGILAGVKPIRMLPRSNENSAEKAGAKSFSEKKKAAEHFVHRQSISERKAPVSHHVGEAAGRSWLPKPQTAVRKGLDFSERKKSPTSKLQKSGKPDEDSFDFLRPLPVDKEEAKNESKKVQTHKSLAELIQERESLTGFPRESFSALFRQSLSRAELDRMFEDDSTGNFEKLELRLKTPKRAAHKPASSIALNAKPKGFELSQKDERGKDVLSDPQSGMIEEENARKETGNSSLIESCESKDEPEVELKSKPEEMQHEAVEPEVVTTDDNHQEPDEQVWPNEEDLAAIEVYEIEFEDSRMSIGDLSFLDRSLSLNDLNSHFEADPDVEDVPEVVDEGEARRALDEVTCEQVLRRSLSDEDVAAEQLPVLDSVMETHLAELETYRVEQAKIEHQLQNLMLESLKRKEQFRQVWGFSPKSINRNRKTMIGAHQVSFSDKDETNDPTLSKLNSESTEESEDRLLVEQIPLGENFDNNEKDGTSFSFDVSIPTDLFEQLIDANLPRVLRDVDLEELHSVEEVFASVHVDDAANHAADNRVDVGQSEMEIEELSEDLGEHYEAHELSNISEEDQNQLSSDVEKKDLDDDDSNKMVLEEPNPDLNKYTPDDRPCQESHEPEEEVENVPSFSSLIAAAKSFHRETKRKQKSVRFLTPVKVQDISCGDFSNDVIEEFGDVGKENVQGPPPSISVHIPVRMGQTRANISFNEAGLFATGLVHTPVPKKSGKMALTIEEDDDDSGNFVPILTTPMVLRNISNKAQQSLASLYETSPDQQQDLSPSSPVHQQRSSNILFDDE